MGYDIEYKGLLKFQHDLTLSEFKVLGKILGEDTRDHPEWCDKIPARSYVTYIDLTVDGEIEGLEWNGAEKSHSMEDQINLVISLMRDQYPNFGLVDG